ncbi:MAG TPA: hypothetical protein VIM22_02485 [Solirubrobacteraceae bacterium]
MTTRRRAQMLLAAGLVAVLVCVGGAGAGARGPAGPRIGGCPFFPASNAWNRDVSNDPVDPRSDAYIASINAGGNRFLHADFGGNGQYGIPFRVVPRTQKRVPIHFDAYGDESDRGPYPIPLNAPVEGGSDRHVLVAQRGTCKLFELYAAHRSGNGWVAGSGAVFNLRSNRLRHEGWTSADAAGLPILAGLARYDEVHRGAIRHALRFTVQDSQRGYIHPATHLASSDSNPNLPPMGLRVRLKASYPIGGFHGQAKVILVALKRYGMIVADNGSPWFITGGSDRRWSDDDLNQLKRVPGAAFEAVRSGPIHHG